mmetsp:Transcript_140400/g.244475  ORF Transcript_140400/g.244475 Transcript_140400/m.244475 type:complete len:628 (-) Transcript_140400:140-2023(-)
MGGCISKDKDDEPQRPGDSDEDSEEDDKVGLMVAHKKKSMKIRTSAALTQKEMTKIPEFDIGLAELHTGLTAQWVSPEQVFAHLDPLETGFIQKKSFQGWLAELRLSWWWTKYGETIWQILDDDGSGNVGVEKLKKFLKRAQMTQQQTLMKSVKDSGYADIEINDATIFVALIAMPTTMTVCQQFVATHLEFFLSTPLVTTAGTAAMLENIGIKVAKKVHSGAIGGHQEIGDLVCTKRVAAVIFFRDPLATTAEHCDTEALIRVCDVHQIPLATNPGTATGVFMFLQELGLQYREAQNKDSVLAKYKASRAAVIAKVQVAGSEAASGGVAPAAIEEAPEEDQKEIVKSPSTTSAKGALKRSQTMSVKDEVTLNDGLVTLYQTLNSKWISTGSLFKHLDPNDTGKVGKEAFEHWLEENGLEDWWDMFGPFIWSIFDEDETGEIDLAHFSKGMSRAEQAYYQKMQEQAIKGRKPSVGFKMTEETRFVSLVAHDEMKPSMMKFVEDNFDYMMTTPLVTTGTTGKSLEKMGLKVGKKVNSGPVGGDQEIAAMGCNGKVAAVFFFKDPLTALPHSADIEALVRVCDVHGIPYATNPGTARGVLLALKKFGLQWREKANIARAAGITAAPPSA